MTWPESSSRWQFVIDLRIFYGEPKRMLFCAGELVTVLRRLLAHAIDQELLRILCCRKRTHAGPPI
jgi:hypothetical protein